MEAIGDFLVEIIFMAYARYVRDGVGPVHLPDDGRRGHLREVSLMGRHYHDVAELGSPCRPREHSFTINGTCWRCRHTLRQLVKDAEELLQIYKGIAR